MPGKIVKMFPFATHSFCNVYETETFYYNFKIYHLGLEPQGNTLGDIIKYNRLLKKITQKELANKLNVHVTTVIKWETGISSPSKNSIKFIQKMLDIKF